MKEPLVSRIEQRRQRRYSLVLPVDVQAPAQPPLRTSTKDISTQGICFSGPRAMEVGSKLEWQLTLPPELCQGGTVRLHCHGRIVRVERMDGQGSVVGIAATIERYKFVRPN